jgi:hypothetical protein
MGKCVCTYEGHPSTLSEGESGWDQAIQLASIKMNSIGELNAWVSAYVPKKGSSVH